MGLLQLDWGLKLCHGFLMALISVWMLDCESRDGSGYFSGMH
uniref:Uncharacterized protein n=1 Tax=Rhizophora mucronata TaxID=61149 RepID=A0A2P2PZE0_RHIMU